MLNLAIECSGFAGSVALCHGRELIAKCQLPSEVGSVQSLAAAIDDLLRHFGPSSPRRVDLISVTHGPGSFTGLRVGLATAQMLAFAWNIPLAPVDTLAAIAYGVCRNYSLENSELGQGASKAGSTIIVPVLNAFRKQVFAAAWLMDRPAASGADQQHLTQLPGLARIAASQVLDAPAWQAQPWQALVRLKSDEFEPVDLAAVLVCGPGLRTYTPIPHSTVSVADQRSWEPDALGVAQLGWGIFQAGEAVSADELRPNYVRASAAEELAR